MLTRNQKSKMVSDIKELKDYLDKRFNQNLSQPEN